VITAGPWCLHPILANLIAQQRRFGPMSDDELGPIDYLVVEFPGERPTGDEFALLLDAVDRGTIRVLDLEFVAKAADGAVHTVDLEGLDLPADVDLATWEGAASALLDEADLAAIGDAIHPGRLAGIVIYENLWTLKLDAQLHAHGAHLVLNGRILPEEIMAALDATELQGGGAGSTDRTIG